MRVTVQTVEALKAEGHYFAAGALAFRLRAGRNYGCHMGMRSTLDMAKEEFNQGYDAAQRR
jgi:hypothetical protein